MTDKDGKNKILTAALWYRGKGYSVIPVGAGESGKKPFVTWRKYQRKKPTEQQIRRWWETYPDAKPAIVTGEISGVMVVDVDTLQGHDELNKFLPDTLTTPVAQTPSGGRHYHFKYRAGLVNKARVITGCDVRTEGGYIIVPPGKNGRGSYSWTPGLAPHEVELAEMPDTLFNALKKNCQQLEGEKPETGTRTLSFEKGNRDETLFSIANTLAKGGMAPEKASKCLQIVGAACNPPFPEKEIRAKINSAYKRHKPTTQLKISFVPIGTIETKPPEFLIQDLLETDSLSLTFGDPGCGKSFFGINMAACIATGADFHGLKAKQGPVIYIAGEGQSGIARRFLAWGIRRDIDYKKAPIFVSLAPVGLCDADQVDAIIESVRAIGEQAGPPIAIFIDTLARNFGPGDENSTADMTRFIAGIDRIREIYHSAVHIIHHSGHADKTRARGSMALKGAVDAEYSLTKNNDGIVRMECKKLKDAELPETMAFKIRSVALPLVDADGEPVTSAVLDRVDYEPVRPVTTRRGANQARGLKILQQLYDEHRANVERDGRNPISARVLTSDWRNACNMHRQAFSRIKKSLSETGEIQIENPYVYLTVTPSCHASHVTPL